MDQTETEKQEVDGRQMDNPFTDNSKKNRFEYSMNGSIAFANYRHDGSTLYIDYVETPSELRGTGAAGKLMQYIMEFAQKENLKIIPICSYAASWMAQHNKPPKSGP